MTFNTVVACMIGRRLIDAAWAACDALWGLPHDERCAGFKLSTDYDEGLHGTVLLMCADHHLTSLVFWAGSD